MSIIVECESTSDRRNFLKLVGGAGAVASILPFAGTVSAAEMHNHAAVAAVSRVTENQQPRSEKAWQAAAVQRDLWVGHIFWIRNVSFATLNKNDAAVKTAEQQVFANAHLIAGTIEPFYGAGAKDSFFKLLAGHDGAVKAYLVATADGNAAAQATATQSITSNAEDIAVFLSKANPYLPKDTLYSVLLAHGAHHIQQILELKDRKYDSEARTWEDMKNHVYQVADATADALAKQFPEAFE
jgi:hypothetical protein